MKNSEYAVIKLEEVIAGLNDIISVIKEGGCPQNEDWQKAAQPLNKVINLMLNFSKYKDEEFGKSKIYYLND